MEEGCLKKQRALSDIISDASDGWPDQSITLRETECAPLPPPPTPALLLPSQNVLVICCCFCLLDYLEILLVLGLETNTDDSRLLMI